MLITTPVSHFEYGLNEMSMCKEVDSKGAVSARGTHRHPSPAGAPSPAQDWFRGPGARHHLCPGPLGSESWAQEPCQEGGLCGLSLQGCSGCVCRSGRGRRTWGREGPPEWLWQLPRLRLWDLMLAGLGSPCTVSSPPFPVIWFSSAKPHNPLRLLTGFQDVTLGVFSRGRSL